MSDIASNITYLRLQLPAGVKIIAVSKTRPESDILQAYSTGQRLFGENRVQEILRKKDNLPVDVEWHLIGHLQTNKVKSVLPFVTMIHSIDSYRLLQVVNEESRKAGKITDCLLQMHIAAEETKSGFSVQELYESIESTGFGELKNVRICGVMGMATFTTDNSQIRQEFQFLADIFKRLKMKYFTGDLHFREISMGMSGDYQIAIEEGSTMVRIGSLIFGERNTKTT